MEYYFALLCQLTVKISRFRILISLLFCSSTTFTMQPPNAPAASWNFLPADVKRYIFPFLASSNVYEVAEAIRVLNATDRFCHGAIQSEEIMLKILERMPYAANAIDLVEKLQRLPGVKTQRIEQWCHCSKKKLVKGQELLQAVTLKNVSMVCGLLDDKNIDLNSCHTSENILYKAIKDKNIVIIQTLLHAGIEVAPTILEYPTFRNSRKIVSILLESGVNPLKVTCYDNVFFPTANDLIFKACEKRKQRLLVLQGKKPCEDKKDDSCLIS